MFTNADTIHVHIMVIAIIHAVIIMLLSFSVIRMSITVIIIIHIAYWLLHIAYSLSIGPLVHERFTQ